jgi:tRNA pseudouridine55 synthase
MDGRPLYEYARKGLPLPRPLEPRKVTVYSLELVEWKGSDHEFRWPEKELSKEEKLSMGKALHSAGQNSAFTDDTETRSPGEIPSAFVLSMRVSGGTYVRSIVHDLCLFVGSAGHVVRLTRSLQGRFAIEPSKKSDRGCVPWDVFRKALKGPGEVDAAGWTEWEQEVLNKLEIVES